jgi:hypothetical protein
MFNLNAGSPHPAERMLGRPRISIVEEKLRPTDKTGSLTMRITGRREIQPRELLKDI